METTMFESNNHHQSINDRTLFEESKLSMMDAYNIGFRERDQAVSEFLSSCISKLKNLNMIFGMQLRLK